MILVIKLSGKVLEAGPARRRLSRQIATLASQGEDLVVVHGGGKQLTDLCRRLQIESIQHNGRRITDAETLKAAKMVFSAINRDLVAALTAKGLRAVGIASFDAQLVRCRRRSPIPVVIPGSPGNEMELVDFGLVGEIESIDPFFLRELWKLETVPVVSCLCADPTGQILNINADTLAAELAVAVGADRLISVSDVKGLYLDAEDPSTRIPEITADQAREYLERGIFKEGMIPKVETILGILEKGVPVAQIVSGLDDQALLLALDSRGGTLFRKST